MVIDSFTGKYSFLSNFSKYNKDELMLYDRIWYSSNEHFYQAMKFTEHTTRQLVAFHESKGLKQYCRTVDKIRPNWDFTRNKVMQFGLLYKFGLPRYRQLLIDTGDAELIEGNTWNDYYWGVCNGKGQNMLGKMLMEIRKNIK